MRTIYILGAGFSKSCGIATDIEILQFLNQMLPREPAKIGQTNKTSIEHMYEQFFGNTKVGFEEFMSALAGLRYMPSYLNVEKDMFSETEEEIIQTLRDYLSSSIAKLNLQCSTNPIRKFVGFVDWKSDLILTFNYDLLLEAAMEKAGIKDCGQILHLHGSLNDEKLIYPNSRKFIADEDRQYFSDRWRKAFQALRDHKKIDQLVFIGYSMPRFDYEARGLFNYADWYNTLEGASYKVVVVNPDKQTEPRYDHFGTKLIFQNATLQEYVGYESWDL